jgi:hypothetical protein
VEVYVTKDATGLSQTQLLAESFGQKYCRAHVGFDGGVNLSSGFLSLCIK